MGFAVRRSGIASCGDGKHTMAFTLVELLVVIAIIGILVAMLLPAVQAAREARRRAQCGNNLKQVGLALHNYHASHKSFPPASLWHEWDVTAIALLGQLHYPAHGGKLNQNWIILILPYMEQNNTYDAFDLKKYIPDPANATARRVKLPVMICPSDPNSQRLFDGTSNPTACDGSSNGCTAYLNDGWGRTNYAANASLAAGNGGNGVSETGPQHHGALPASKGWTSKHYRGVMGANASQRIDDIRDGTSNTVLVGEIKTGITSYDPRGVWAMSHGSSCLWSHGSVHPPSAGPNRRDNANDAVISCNVLVAKFGSDELRKMGMGCYGGGAGRQTTGSYHPGGIHVVFGDGGVRWIGDFVDTNGNTDVNPPQLSVWDRLMASSDGEVISAGAF